MKIYNKKGFFFGLFWTLIGASWLTLCFVKPNGFPLLQVKHLFFAAVLLLGGITGVTRSFSQRATKEDKIEALDERNALVKLKYRAKTGQVMEWICFGGCLLSLGAYLLTEELVWGCFAIAFGLVTGLGAILELALSFYYERKE